MKYSNTFSHTEKSKSGVPSFLYAKRLIATCTLYQERKFKLSPHPLSIKLWKKQGFLMSLKKNTIFWRDRLGSLKSKAKASNPRPFFAHPKPYIPKYSLKFLTPVMPDLKKWKFLVPQKKDRTLLQCKIQRSERKSKKIYTPHPFYMTCISFLSIKYSNTLTHTEKNKKDIPSFLYANNLKPKAKYL